MLLEGMIEERSVVRRGEPENSVYIEEKKFSECSNE
jgi:hypothetical protein